MGGSHLVITVGVGVPLGPEVPTGRGSDACFAGKGVVTKPVCAPEMDFSSCIGHIFLKWKCSINYAARKIRHFVTFTSLALACQLWPLLAYVPHGTWAAVCVSLGRSLLVLSFAIPDRQIVGVWTCVVASSGKPCTLFYLHRGRRRVGVGSSLPLFVIRRDAS